jgi:hypothetical protein
VSLGFGEAWPRFTRMGWEELHTRVQQEIGKRLDAGLSRVGLQPWRTALNQPPTLGQFFSPPEDLSERANLIRQYLPAEASAIVNEADSVCRHRFRLLGYADLQYASEIDWHLDVVHGKRAPLKPWFRIDFLNSEEVGDHKIIWELNRHQHLVTLAKAWLLTRDDRFANELMSQWYGWRRANPYPLGINWASSLEVGFRSLAWLWVHHLLAGCPALRDTYRTDLLHGLALNGRHIERYLSTYYSPNTHLLGEATALFFIGVLCPQIPAASHWREKGLGILLEQAGRQVYADGVYFEQSLYYHVYALDLFLHTRLLAGLNHIEIPRSFDQVIEKMLAVLQALSQTGPPDGFGDDDGGRVFNPRRNRAEHMTDPLAIGAVLFSSEPLRASATLTEESIWLLGEQATGLIQQRSAKALDRAQSFRNGGIYISFRSGDCPQQLTIDAGPQGAMRCGHGHADALSIRLSLDGRAYLTDLGTFSYMGSERNLFRGTGAHNTLRVDGLDQAVAQDPFSWSEVPSVHVDSWITGDTFTFFSGHHTGYLRLADPVLHQRFVVHLDGNFFLVRDVAQGSAPHEFEIFWHLAQGLTITRTGACFVASGGDRQGAGTKLALVPPSAAEWNYEITPGYVSPAYGALLPAQVLRCSATLRLPAEHAMIVRALVQEHENAGELVCLGTAPAGPTAYEYRENRRSHLMIFADPQAKTWSFGDLASDARFIYYCCEGQRVSQFIACQGSYVRYREEPLLTFARMVEHFECCETNGRRQISSSDPESLTLFQNHALESWNAGVVG